MAHETNDGSYGVPQLVVGACGLPVGGCGVKRWIHNLREFVIAGGRDESPLRFDVWVLFRTSLRCPPTTRNSIRTLPNLLPLSSVARRGTSHHAVGNKNV